MTSARSASVAARTAARYPAIPPADPPRSGRTTAGGGGGRRRTVRPSRRPTIGPGGGDGRRRGLRSSRRRRPAAQDRGGADPPRLLRDPPRPMTRGGDPAAPPRGAGGRPSEDDNGAGVPREPRRESSGAGAGRVPRRGHSPPERNVPAGKGTSTRGFVDRPEASGSILRLPFRRGNSSRASN